MPVTLRPARRPMLLLVAGLLVAACGSAAPSATSQAPAGSPSLTPVPIPSEPASPDPSPSLLPPGATEVFPSSPPASIGDAEVITVFTHCGLEGQLDWAGSFWREVRRIPEGGAIGDPEDTGRITLVSGTEAAFESSTGTVVLLERLPGPAVLFLCD